MNKIKTFFIKFVAILLALQGAVAAELLNLRGVHAGAGTPEVVINELMWMGSYSNGGSNTADEWIELRNTTALPVDISGWQLTGVGLPVFPPGSVVPSGGFFLVSNYPKNHPSSILDVDPDWVDSSISISNSCLPITLVRGDLSLADSMGCNGGSYFAGVNQTGSDPLKQSMERKISVGDGNVSDSWQTSVGFANLDANAAGYNNATAKVANDPSAADGSAAQVNDGLGADIDWSADKLSASANWSGFVDPESGVSAYEVALIEATSLAPASAVETVFSTSHTFALIALSLTEGETYFAQVTPINGAGIKGTPVLSDGFTIDTVDPATPANLAAQDVPNDNGGAVKLSWDASVSMDVFDYQVNYRKVGSGLWLSQNTGGPIELVISGLENSPSTYEVTVQAVDFNGQKSPPSPIVIAVALDNLSPVIDGSKVTVSQNRPGTDDTLSGQAGAVNEPGSTINVFDRNPADPGAVIIGSVVSNPDGSWAAIGIGDNQHAMVWLQAVDLSGNTSTAESFDNDIVGPAPATLERLRAECPGEICRVGVSWSPNSADTSFYQLGYRIGSVETRTFDLVGTSVQLDLASGVTSEFVVYAFDEHGNEALPSNKFIVTLVRGVITTVVLIGGNPVISTEAISGSREVIEASADEVASPLASFVPRAEAASGEQEPEQEPLIETSTNRDWVRILIVIILLLIVAGSFWAISRSLQSTPEEAFDKAKKSRRATGGKKRRRGRPRRGR